MDRGYPSTPAFIHMMDKGIKFIVRLKSSDYKKEQSSLSENDQLGQSDIRNPLSLLAHNRITASQFIRLKCKHFPPVL